MISYIRGTLAEVLGDTVVVEAGQVGVNIRVPLTVTEQLPRIGEEVLIYTYLKVSEDALTLFGFLTRRDLDLFRRLITVNGTAAPCRPANAKLVMKFKRASCPSERETYRRITGSLPAILIRRNYRTAIGVSAFTLSG